MELFRPIQFPFSERLAKLTTEFMSDKGLNGKDALVCRMSIPEDLKNSINQYLNERGVSNIRTIVAFKRINRVKSIQRCHIDGNKEFTVHASLVIPVSGCKNTGIYWYHGDYTLRESLIAKDTSYMIVHWRKPAQFLGEIEISQSPVLCNVGVPHSAYSNGTDPRIVLTLRFEKNEEFKYIADALSK